MKTTEIKNLFKIEFEAVRDKFEIYDLSLEEAEDSQAPHIWKPGVYVFYNHDRTIKVGRHLTNSRKRALEHLHHNTGGKMSDLRNDQESRLLLFNVKNTKDRHWVAALEIFFEENLSPEIKAERLG